MDRQQVFDTVARAIIEQGKPSMTDTGECLYRGPDGTKCAAGWLIPDEEYHPGMESTQASWIAGQADGPDVPQSPTLKAIAQSTGFEFLNRLQMAHDGAGSSAELSDDFLEDYRNNMVEVASAFGLKRDVIDG